MHNLIESAYRGKDLYMANTELADTVGTANYLKKVEEAYLVYRNVVAIVILEVYRLLSGGGIKG